MSIIFDEFKNVDKAAWIAKINKDLKGKKLASDFSFSVEGSIEVDPFLSSEDQKYLEPLVAPITKSGFKILEKDSEMANQIALKMLENGAEALFFRVDTKTDFTLLFEDIMLEMITIVIDMDSEHEYLISSLSEYISLNYKDKSTDIIINSDQKCKGFYTIIENLKQDVDILDRLKKFNKTICKNLENSEDLNLAVSLELKTDFLAQIAEIRAIRVLWANMLEMHDIDNQKPLKIICEIGPDDCVENEINPLIKINYQMMSAYLGTSDLCFGPYGRGDLEQQRLGLNIQQIFKEEAGLTDVIDPTAGSYLIEELTEQFVRKSWESALVEMS